MHQHQSTPRHGNTVIALQAITFRFSHTQYLYIYIVYTILPVVCMFMLYETYVHSQNIGLRLPETAPQPVASTLYPRLAFRDGKRVCPCFRILLECVYIRIICGKKRMSVSTSRLPTL